MKSILASASWDKTVRLWDMFDSWRTKETLTLMSDGELQLGLADSDQGPKCPAVVWLWSCLVPLPALLLVVCLT